MINGFFTILKESLSNISIKFNCGLYARIDIYYSLNAQIMENAVAFSNNDVITIAWSFGKKPVGCMGFAIYRINKKNEETLLPSFAVFDKKDKDQKHRTTVDFPVQKFYWKDVYARLEAEKTNNRTFRYKIVPLSGVPGQLKAMPELPFIISNEVTIGAEVGDGMYAYFNRGLISTQRISDAFNADPKKVSLLARVADYKGKDILRDSLSGDMVEALTQFLDRANSSGRIYAALYELGDDELKDRLLQLGDKLSIVLSNSRFTEDDLNKPLPKKKPDDRQKYKQIEKDHNQKIREDLEKGGAEIFHRIMLNGFIGHNKFLIYVDAQNIPTAVLFGSTNWTSSGLCTQTNNTMVVENKQFARRYMDYWEQLRDDNKNANGDRKSLQGINFRKWNSKGLEIKIKDQTVFSWFSPNTPEKRGTDISKEARPVDMTEVVKCIDNAQHSILFLAFYPGSPSIANWTAQALRKNKELFVRGCVTNKSASDSFYYELKGITQPKKEKGEKYFVKEDYRVFGATAFDGDRIPEGWQKEILAAGHAIIHDKVMVIDPFSENCITIVGSHNLGHRASYNNDENMVIIRGNNKLALAYATHILDVYDHFSFRWWVKKYGKTDYFLEKNPEVWLGKYFDSDGAVINSQLKFWMQATL